jgi:uncharacterized caspase-like protein
LKNAKRTLLIFSMVLLCLGCTGAAAQESVALIIGNGEYEHTTRLKNPVNDATALAEKLEELGFTVIHGNNLSKKKIEKQITSFGKLLEKAEISVFFYAGHGLQINGKNYLIPTDFNLDDEVDLSERLVDLDDILGQMASDECVNLVFLDACRDNPFANDIKANLSSGRSLTVEETRAIKVVGQGLAEVEGGVGTLIAFATQPGNVALDGSGDHSPFTSGLLKYMGKPGTEVSDMLKNVRKHVLEETDGKQIPWDHSSLTERYYFKKKKQKRAPPP